ncbi:hypothetical protein FGE12_18050 [Aggregicoccus sp. 17bor-14]|uniref:hypothetical protein n=1 Tax=Myxococcaceae TaxID=31 RepID=UPI00129CE0FF|nr:MULTISPECIES: hypothetical protein [Myxococcaceae]MBF5044306.1 hypothetical protein [Simulacricoccus sp. 17bor-14]MRI90055.1 hypothetical protein [Aggregicoccus sp. 17bor-14]
MRLLNVVGAALVALAVAGAGEAQAQRTTASAGYSSRGQGWSVLSGETVGQGNNVFSAQVGWPGISASLLHGGTDRFDIGGRFAFNWGVQKMVEFTQPGISLSALMKLNLLDTGRFNLGMTFEPGPFFIFSDFRSDVGLDLPVGLQLGVPVGNALMLSGGIDLPLWVTFGDNGGLWVPVLFGGGLEYFIDRNLSVNFKVRMGPTFSPNYGNRSDSFFSLESLVGIAVKL